MRILAVETSCDETAAAIVSKEPGEQLAIIETSIVASQVPLHQKYGGVYPEVASREHVRQILPIISEALELPMSHPNRLPDFSAKNIDYLAVTHGPGLIGSLLVGTQTMAALSMATGIPLLQVNHLAGHIYASFIDNSSFRISEASEKSRRDLSQARDDVPQFPLMALVVSGGHSMLIYMESHHTYQLLGQTRDDAVGEAFDKVAKLLGLPYPGGPQISKLATQGDREARYFPIGLEKEDTLDFSFSGLKTAVLREVQNKDLTPTQKANIAASFERAAIEALLTKTAKALNQFPVKDFILGGGVAANSYLRDRLASLLAYRSPAVTFHVPPINLCTDNAAVIGAAAAFSTLTPTEPSQLQTFARLPLV